MTYTYTLEGIFESVPETKKLAVDRPRGTFSKAKWIEFASDFCDRMNAPEPSDTGESADDAQESPSMKLIDILARELKFWPEMLGEKVGQCHDGKLHGFAGGGHPGCTTTAASYSKCRSYGTEVVTRAEWQAAVDAIYADEPADPAKLNSRATHDERKKNADLRLSAMIEMGWLQPIFTAWPEVPEYDFSIWPPERFDCDSLPSIYVQSFGRGKRNHPPKTEPESAAVWDGEGLPPVGIECEVHDCQHEYTKQFNGQNVRIVAHHVNLRGNNVAVFEAGDCVYHGLVSEKFRPIRTAEQIATEKREKAISEIASATGLRPGGGRIEVAMALYDAGYRKQ